MRKRTRFFKCITTGWKESLKIQNKNTAKITKETFFKIPLFSALFILVSLDLHKLPKECSVELSLNFKYSLS